VKEIEIIVDNAEKTQSLLEEAGFVAFRVQEKKRHSYTLDSVIIDVDTWPSTPSYVEIEGDSEQKIKKVAEKMGFEWDKAVFRGAGWIIEQYLNVSVRDLKYLTFEKIE
jgi:adenylate cyclase class 2